MSHLRLHPSTSTSAQPWVTQASSVAGPSRPPLSRTPSPSPQPLVAIPLPPGSCTASPHLSRRRKLAGVETVNENPGGSKGKGKATAKARVPSGGERRAARGEGERANGSGRVCLAVDRWEERCEAPVGSVGGAFCAVHEAEAGVVRAEYERFSRPPDSNKMLTASVAAVEATVAAIEEPEQLEASENFIRLGLQIIGSAQDAASYHARHFAADPEGPLDWRATGLEAERQDLEAKLDLFTARSHELILAIEDALWLCPSDPSYLPPAPLAPCHSATPPQRPPAAPPLATETEEPNPMTAQENRRRSELLELLSLTGSHASFISDAQKSVERVRVVECLFRRVVSRDHELLLLAYRSGCDHILRFIEQLPFALLEQLWLHLQETDAGLIRASIRDAFRAVHWEESGATETETGEDGQGLQVLGGWTYKTDAPADEPEMGWREWAHFYDLCGCSGCALRCCGTFQEWMKIRRLSVVAVNGKTAPYKHWADPGETDAVLIMRCLDLVACSPERTGIESEVRRVGGGFVGAKGKGLYLERQERNWVFIKMSLTHPRAVAILTALSASFTLVVRSTRAPTSPLADFPVPPAAHLWFSRFRSSPSRAALRHESWATDPAGFGPNNAAPLAVLDALDSPEKAQGLDAWGEVYEMLVLDGFGREGEGTGRTAGANVVRSYEAFAAEVGQGVLGACGRGDVVGAREWGAAESLRRGDVVMAFAGPGGAAGGGGGGAVSAAGGAMRRAREGDEGVDKLRDDKLALKLSRSLFK